jgi:phage I-like protein
MTLKFPADFDQCVQGGGKIRTMPVKDHPDKYMHVCVLNGKSHAGEVKTKKEMAEENAYLQSLGFVEKEGEMVKGSEIKLHKLVPQIELGKANFSEKSPVSDIEVLASGSWDHPQYGHFDITEEDIDGFVQSFNNKVRKVDIAVDQEHMPEKGAAGWYKALNKVFEDGKCKLKATIEWTKLGTQLIKDGIFKYFSPEFDFQYEDLETHEQFGNVLLGGALTNRPYFKSLAPVALSENMYAGFINLPSKFTEGGENRMLLTKEELKAKLAENAEFVLAADAADEEKVAFEEAKTELAKETEEKEEAERVAQEEADAKAKADAEAADAVKASEKFISKADHVKEMNELKSQLGIVNAKLRFTEVTKQVEGYIFSESNVDGVLLPKAKDATVKLFMEMSPKAAGLFAEFLKALPKVSVSLFKEAGGEGGEVKGNSETIEAEANKIMSERNMKYGSALKVLRVEKPELFK